MNAQLRLRVSGFVICATGLFVFYLCAWYIMPSSRSTTRSNSLAGQDYSGLIANPNEIVLSDEHAATHKVTVDLTNSSRSAIHITNIRTTCGCTAISGTLSTTVMPHETFSLQVEASVPAIGDRFSQIQIYTESDTNPTILIPVKMSGRKRVAPYFSYVPERIDIRERLLEDEVAFIIEFQTVEYASRPAWITEIVTSDSVFVPRDVVIIERSGTVDGFEHRTYRATIGCPSITSTRQCLVRFKTASLSLSDESVRVVQHYVPSVSISPSQIVFSRGSQVDEKSILVTSQFMEEFDIRILSNIAGISVVTEPPGNSVSHILRIKYERESYNSPDGGEYEVLFSTSVRDFPIGAIVVLIE